MAVGVLYYRRKVKPFIAFIGLAALVLIDVYDMHSYSSLHNFFAIIFFVIQPVIFYWEYKKKKDSWAMTKMVVLLGLIVLLMTGFLPLPLFEFLSYACLIMFL